MYSYAKLVNGPNEWSVSAHSSAGASPLAVTLLTVSCVVSFSKGAFESSSDTGVFDDVALNEADVSLMATQPGRDAGRLVCRLLFSQNYLAVRSVMVPVIRGAARAAVRTASVFDRAVPTTLPHEACASLFGDRLDDRELVAVRDSYA